MYVRTETIVIKNPIVTALLSGAVVAWTIYSMATARESPRMVVAVLQYVVIGACLWGLVGALRQILAARE